MMKMLDRLLRAALFAGITLGIAPAALAHDDATLATLKSPHGGQLKVAGPWHMELLQKKSAKGAEQTLIIYLTDHDGRPIATQGMSGSAQILVGKLRQAITLQPDGDHRMKGLAAYDTGAGPKIVVSITAAGKTEQARFTP